jgi:3',5'-cyclic AMP phosphodiesterase CpdA
MPHAVTHALPIPSHLTRHSSVGKARRQEGDPVAALKDMTRFEPIPHPPPQRLAVPFSVFDPDASIAAENAKKIVFHFVGDVGGVNGTATQEAISEAMEDQLMVAAPKDRPRFLYIVGDVVYFNGQQKLYKTEFYEPYQYYRSLIFAVPGNHDGDTHVRKGDKPDTEPSLYGFIENFCATSPTHASPYRMSMTQPYPYWTLEAPFVTIIGLYSNVEGSLDGRGRSDQQFFLEDQLRNADPTKKVLIAVHHPPFSLDSVHGGCPDILNAIDRAVFASKRMPDAVLSGHVHNYQRFSRKVKDPKTNRDRTIPYVIAGAGGYADQLRSMHRLQKGLLNKELPFQTTHPDVKLENFNQTEPGFLRITVDQDQILFEYFLVSFDDGAAQARLFETFTA